MTEISTQFDNLFTTPLEDRSVEKYEYRELVPDESLSESTKQYQITNRDADGWYNYGESFLKLTVKVTAADIDVVAMQNCAAALFERVELKADNTRIDIKEYPGLSGQIMGLIKNSDDYRRTTGSTQMWSPDTSVGAGSDKYNEIGDGGGTPTESTDYNEGWVTRHAYMTNKGVDNKTADVHLMVPVKDLLAICDGWESPLKGIKMSLHLTKNKVENVLHAQVGAGADPKVTITKMAWWIPTVTPSIPKMLELEQEFNRGTPIPVHFNKQDVIKTSPFDASTAHETFRVASLSTKPVKAFVAFQLTSRQDNLITTNSQVFDHLDMESVYLKLNGQKYPEEPFTPDFTSGDYTREFTALLSNDGCIFEADGCGTVNYQNYKSLYPIYSFDMSSQAAGLFDRTSVADLSLHWKRRSKTTNDSYHAVIVLITEGEVLFNPISESRVRVLTT